MSTHNMSFYGELTKIILELSPNTLLISSTRGGGENIGFSMDPIGSSIGINLSVTVLYPWHLCRGVYSFRLSGRMFVRNFVLFMELLQSFTLKQFEWSISHQPLIREHSYLDHRYPGGSSFIPWLLTQGSMPRGGARGQNLGHLVFFYFSVIETTYADSWLDMAQPCDMDL